MKQLEVDMLGDPFVMGEKTRRTYLTALLGTDDDGTEGDPPPWEGEHMERTKNELTQIKPQRKADEGAAAEVG